ncbi:novel immune-type receptor 2 precursor [Ictalurus punctatus]|uniref:Novel immune-type receptor 2 n=1 Tax=Ictalurus punctatus TaxID=7998 RepID=Q8UUG3_ICTPU|nr:novel immune-type receptor 2 precursor [Ictalurus punctatus]AAL35543.1 novel immune-type receptor 2 [Ictalurus punctatus]AAL35555.1 novel immune-type receptor 2 [Ictalurus punctatus]
MLTAGFILLLCPLHLVKTQTDFRSNDSLVFAKEGDSVNISCIYESDMAMHFSWYKYNLGQKPKLISNFYKYDKKATFHHEFKNNARFSMVNEKSKTNLEIKGLQLSDSATYFCGSAHSNIVEFGEGTELVVQASQHSLSVLQQPVHELAHPGGSVTLHCTVITDRCAGEHSVYWFRHNSGESHPGVIYTHGDSNGRCKKNPKAGSLTRMCVYSLPKTNLSTSDVGTYHCAVAACGQILFGNGTKLDMKITGLVCFENLQTLVLFSIVRSVVLLCCVILIMIYFCCSKKAKCSVRRTTKGKKNLAQLEK